MRRLIAVAALSVVAACGDVRDAGLPVVRDSAGVTIAEYPEGVPLLERFRLSESPVLEIGETDGADELLFSRIVAAFAGTDGTTIVADRVAGEIRWFSAEGRHIRSVGGLGEGPGEFRVVSRVGSLRGDTIGVWDASAERLSLFDSDGEYVSSYGITPLEEDFASPRGTTIYPAPQVTGIYADGSLLAQPPLVYLDVSERIRRDSIPLLLFDRGLREWMRVGTTLGYEIFLASESGEVPSLPLPFGLRTRRALAGNWVVFGWGDETGLTVIGRDGRIQALIRPGFERPLVTAEEIARDREERLAAASETERPELRRILDEVVYPDRKPAHGVVVAADDEIWVQESGSQSSDADDRWFVFTREGRVLSSVTVPAGLQVTDVGPRHLIGVQLDELGVPKVHKFELERSGTRDAEANFR